MQRLHQQRPQPRNRRGQVSAHPPRDAGRPEKAIVRGVFRHTGHIRSCRALNQTGRGRIQIRRHRGTPGTRPGPLDSGRRRPVTVQKVLPAKLTSSFSGSAARLDRRRHCRACPNLADDSQSACLLTRIAGSSRTSLAADDQIRATAVTVGLTLDHRRQLGSEAAVRLRSPVAWRWPSSGRHRRPPLARAGPAHGPAAAWPPAVALGRGVCRVVLPPGGRARLAVLAMGAHIWQHAGGRGLFSGCRWPWAPLAERLRRGTGAGAEGRAGGGRHAAAARRGWPSGQAGSRRGLGGRDPS